MATPKAPKRVSLGDIESKSEIVPVGLYHARIISNPMKKNKAGDGFYFNPDLQILSEGAAKNRHIWDVWPLKESALFKLKAGLVACGVDPEAEVEIDEVPSLTEGCVVDIVVTDADEYQGEPRTKVARIKPSTMPSLDDLAEEENEDEEEEEEEDDSPYTEDELTGMDSADLIEIGTEYEVYKKGMKRSALVAAILKAQEEASEEEEEEEEESGEESEEDDDLFDEEPSETPKKKKVRR